MIASDTTSFGSSVSVDSSLDSGKSTAWSALGINVNSYLDPNHPEWGEGDGQTLLDGLTQAGGNVNTIEVPTCVPTAGVTPPSANSKNKGVYCGTTNLGPAT